MFKNDPSPTLGFIYFVNVHNLQQKVVYIFRVIIVFVHCIAYNL